MISDKNARQTLLEHWGLEDFQFLCRYKKTDRGGRFITLLHPQTKKRLKFPDGAMAFVNNISRLNAAHNEQYTLKCSIAPKHLREKWNEKWNAEFALTPISVTPLVKPTKEVKTTSTPEQGIIEKLFHELSSSERLAGMVARVIPTFGADMNKQELSFLFEIIQNANDYPDGDKPVHLDIEITEEQMVIRHNGTPFEAHHVDSLCNILKTTKEEGEDKIGYKGIGFKSIFSISEYVHIESGKFSFRFDKSYHEDTVDFPWQIAPIWTESASARNTAPNVRIECRLIQNRQFAERILHRFQGHEFDESSILFLPNVEEVVIRIMGDEFRFNKERNTAASKWKFYEAHDIAIPDDIRNQLAKSDVAPEKLKELNSTHLQFATRHTSDEDFEGKIFVFLPTRLTTGLPFHLNGNFIPDVSRHELNEDLEWNHFLIQQAGVHLIHWIGANQSSELKQANTFSFVPNRARMDMGPWEGPFIEGIREGLDTIPVIPCTDNQIHKIGEVTLDCIGVENLVGEALLREAFEIKGPIALPSEHILAGAGLLDEFLDGSDGVRRIEWDDLLDAWNSDAFRVWLIDANNCKKAIKFLHKHNRLDGDHYIIPNEQGEFCSIEETNTDFPGDAELAHCLGIHIAKKGIFDDVEKHLHPEPFSIKTFIDELLDDSTRVKQIESRFQQHDNPNGLLHFLHWNQNILSREHFNLIYKWCGVMDSTGTWHNHIDQITEAFLFQHLLEPISELTDHFGFALIGGPLGTHQQDSEHASWLGFLIDAKVPQMTALEFYRCWLSPILQDTAHSDHPWHSQELQNIVWTYLCAGWNQLGDEEKSELKKLTKQTPVITSNGALEKLKRCSPGAENALVEIVKAFNLRHHFLHPGYPKSLQEQLVQLGGKRDESDLIGPILERIPELGGEDLIKATQFLFQFRDRKKLNLESLNFPFKLIDSEGTERLASDCLLPKQLETSNETHGLPSPPKFRVSSQYLKGEKDEEWRSFFERLGLNTSKRNTFRIKALGWAEAEIKSPSDPQSRSKIWPLLAQEHAAGELPDNVLHALRGIQLHAVDTHGKAHLEAAGECFFGSNLHDEIDLQSLAAGSDQGQLRFVAEIVEPSEATRAFLLDLGVQDALQPIEREAAIPVNQLPEDYLREIRKNNADLPKETNEQDALHLKVCLPGIELLDNPHIAKAFWEGPCTQARFWRRVQIKSVYHRVGSEEPQTSPVPSLVFWRLNHQPFIPTKNEGLVPAIAIPEPQLKHLLPDAPTPELDMELDIAGTLLWERLDCKNQLSLDECLGAIHHGKWRSSGTKKPILATQLTQAIEDVDDTTLQEALSKHIKDLNWGWPNQMGAFKPANQLAVMTGIPETAHHRHILLHRSLHGIADRIHVRTLTKEDVRTTPTAKEKEVDAKPLLLRRLSALAQVLYDETAEAIEAKWRERLDPMKFIGVDVIRQEIDEPEFSSDHLLDHTEGDHFFYLRPFRSMKGAELLKKLMSRDVLSIDEKDKWALADVLTLLDGEPWDEWLIRRGLKERETYNEETPVDDESPMAEEPSEKLETEKEEAQQNGDNTETLDTVPSKEKTWYHHLEEIDLERIRSLFGKELDQTEQANAMIEAMFRGLRFYEKAGWALAGENESEQFKSAIQSREPLRFINGNGDTLDVLCRSAKRGLLWLHEFPWSQIDGEDAPCELFVITGGRSEQHRQFQSRADLIACHSSILGHDEVLLKLGPPRELPDSSLAQTELESAAYGLATSIPNPRELYFIFLVKDKEDMDSATINMINKLLDFYEEE